MDVVEFTAKALDLMVEGLQNENGFAETTFSHNPHKDPNDCFVQVKFGKSKFSPKKTFIMEIKEVTGG